MSPTGGGRRAVAPPPLHSLSLSSYIQLFQSAPFNHILFFLSSNIQLHKKDGGAGINRGGGHKLNFSENSVKVISLSDIRISPAAAPDPSMHIVMRIMYHGRGGWDEREGGGAGVGDGLQLKKLMVWNSLHVSPGAYNQPSFGNKSLTIHGLQKRIESLLRWAHVSWFLKYIEHKKKLRINHNITLASKSTLEILSIL